MIAIAVLFTITGASSLSRFPLKRIEKAKHLNIEYLENFRQLLHNFHTTALVQQGVQPISNLIFFQHYGEIGLGTPSQKLGVLFDTLSSDLWLFSKSSQNCIICRGHRTYDSNSSKTYGKNGETTSFWYLYGNLWGFLSSDNVEVGGMKILNQTFVEVRNGFGAPLFSKSIDGVFGLSFGSLTKSTRSTPLENLVGQGQSPGIFTFLLRRNESSYDKMEKDGMIFGGIDYHLISEEGPTYVPVVPGSKYWMIRIDRVEVDGMVSGCERGCEAILGSSFPGIWGPDGDISKIYSEIGAEPNEDCEADDLPKISFLIGGRKFTLEGKDYVLKGYKNNTFGCLPQLQGLGFSISGATWILGDAFLSKIYTIFDADKKRVGFADFKPARITFPKSIILKRMAEVEDIKRNGANHIGLCWLILGLAVLQEVVMYL